jgi:lipopolysaccharide/colanic/teichoic acid biosynthesis glycosyltransferase
MYQKVFKQITDISIVSLLIVMLSPVILIILITLFLNNNGSLLFMQLRPGKDKKLFTLYKFKTMNDKKDFNGNLLPDNERLTSIGKIIRKLSLDELPQLFNVLKGDMSLIGPRPLLIEYLPLYSEYHKKRHLVKPGISGYAQVKGRNSLSWSEKFDLDVWYVENISFMLDLKIFFWTIYKIIKRDGINSSEKTTMTKFEGYN